MKQLVIIFILCILCIVFFIGNTNAEINDGLVALYTFKNNANDESGNGNTGASHGISYSVNSIGTISNFDGDNDYIQVSNSDSINTSIFSISCWFSLNSDETQTIIDKRNGQRHRNYSISVVDKKVVGDIGDGTNYSVSDSYDLTLNTMYHVVLTYDKDVLILYLNGSEKFSNKIGAISNTGKGNLFIGCHGLKTNFFKGSIESIRIYNRTISHSEIKELYNIGITNIEPVTITSKTFFDNKHSVTIDFESFPNDNSISNNQSLTNQYSIYGVIFSSENNPNTHQNVDYVDMNGRFGGHLTISKTISGGGSPTSGIRYAYGKFHDSSYTADIRIDFITPVDAFALNIIDNDYSDVRLSAYNKHGYLLGTNIVPKVSEGNSTYIGISIPSISYAIIDAKDGEKMDSTFIDDLTFLKNINQNNKNISNEILETLWLNSNDQINTVGTKKLEKNTTYLLKVQGTISLWTSNSWGNVCKGTPEAETLYESPGINNGQVGLDANFLFASVGGASYCDKQLPLKDYRFEISVDGGNIWFHPNFIDNEINSCHSYSYLFNAKGYSLLARYNDEPIDDNYGMLKIEIIKIVDTEYTKISGDYNFNEKLDLGDAIGIIQELSTSNYTQNTKN